MLASQQREMHINMDLTELLKGINLGQEDIG